MLSVIPCTCRTHTLQGDALRPQGLCHHSTAGPGAADDPAGWGLPCCEPGQAHCWRGDCRNGGWAGSWDGLEFALSHAWPAGTWSSSECDVGEGLERWAVLCRGPSADPPSYCVIFVVAHPAICCASLSSCCCWRRAEVTLTSAGSCVLARGHGLCSALPKEITHCFLNHVPRFQLASALNES